MVKMPAGTKEYQEKLQEVNKLVDRMDTGYKMLVEAYRTQSIAKCFKIIEQYGALAKVLHSKAEELTFIHQMNLTGAKMFIRRDGSAVYASQIVDDNAVELTPHLLITVQAIKQIWGEIPHEILEIKD